MLGLYAHGDADERWWAVRALNEFDTPDALAVIRRALQDTDAAVQQCAALALSNNPQVEAIPTLIERLASPDQLLARLAGDALIATGTAASNALIAFLDSGERNGQREAVRALALIGDKRAIATLFKMIDGDSVLADYWADLGLDRMGIGMAFFNPSS